MLLKPLLVLSLAVLATSKSAIPPQQGGISMIQNPSGNGDTRIYYHSNLGDILQIQVSGPVDVCEHIFAPMKLIAPSEEVLPGTPITAAVLGTNTWEEIHIFFLSRDLVLSHYYWAYEDSEGFRGGSSCAECLTKLGIKVSPAMHSLSASIDSVHNVVSVIFTAADSGAISEAVRRNGKWAIGRLR